MQGWPQLPGDVLAGFQQLFRDPLHLASAIDDLDTASQLLRQIFPDAMPEEVADWAAVLDDWKTTNERHFKRARLDLVNASLFRLPVSNRASVGDSYEKITQTSSVCVLEILAKKKQKAYKDETPDARAQRFETERKKYSRLLALLIQEAQLPVAQLVDTLDDPQAAWVHIFAARRANTLKNRYKSWKPFRDWLEIHRGYVFPRSVKDAVDYVQHRVDDGCGKTVPESFHIALTLLEQVGKVPEHERISMDELWKSHVKSWTAELCGEAPPRKSAEMYTVAMLLSLELLVMDVESSVFDRALAWVVLCMVWGAMRCDDVQAVIPGRMLLSNYGLKLVLGKSKTSGPDKRQKELCVHLLRTLSLTGCDWLKEGFEIWDAEPFNFKRDYLVMEPNRTFSGVKHKFLLPSRLSSLILRLLSKLGTPSRSRHSMWELNKTLLLLPDGLESHFTGHSPRNFLTSVAATIGFSKDQRAYLGRWSMGMAASEEYVRTSRQVVFSIQREVNRVLVEGGDVSYFEDEAIDRLCEKAGKDGANPATIRRRHAVFRDTVGKHCLGGAFPGFIISAADSDVLGNEDGDSATENIVLGNEDGDNATENIVPKQLEAASSSLQPVSKYFITVSRRAGLRRLHLVGCFVKPDRCCEVVFTNEVTLNEFDSVCRTCKRKMLAESGKDSQVESSSTASSSSTEGGCEDSPL